MLPYMVFSTGLIQQWGTYWESKSATDYKYFPMAFPNKVCYLNGFESNSPDDYRSLYVTWTWTDSLAMFRCGIGSDYNSYTYLEIFCVGY